MGFDNPFMRDGLFHLHSGYAALGGFSDTGVSAIAHRNAEALYPALADACSGLKPPEGPTQLGSQFPVFGVCT